MQRPRISIHAPHEGERRVRDFFANLVGYFNPRSPRGGATEKHSQVCVRPHISIHAPHEGERLVAQNARNWAFLFQSTLPTRGSDLDSGERCDCEMISIHAPHEGERRCWPMGGLRAQAGFQSTLPTRGSDLYDIAPEIDAIDFNPRSPRGGATLVTQGLGATMHISIHAPHEGERLRSRALVIAPLKFQSTLPTRGSDLCKYL